MRGSEMWEALTDFNSIKVRLELKRPGIRAGRKRFQFHKGAIRTHGSLSDYTYLRISIP